MALHRVDNKLLDEEEYSSHVDGKWAFWLFLISAIATGSIMYFNLDVLGLANESKWIRFSSIIAPSLVAGFIAAKLKHVIRMIIACLIVVSIFASIGMYIWEHM